MRHLATIIALSLAASACAADIRGIRFPFAEEKEMAVFIAETERALAEPQARVWRNGLSWLKVYCDKKRIPYWETLRGGSAVDMILRGYYEHTRELADVIEALAKEARSATGEEAARLRARADELSKSRDALNDEVAQIVFAQKKSPGQRLEPTPGES